MTLSVDHPAIIICPKCNGKRVERFMRATLYPDDPMLCGDCRHEFEARDVFDFGPDDLVPLARRLAAEVGFVSKAHQERYARRALDGAKRYGVPPDKVEHYLRRHLRNWFVSISYEELKKA